MKCIMFPVQGIEGESNLVPSLGTQSNVHDAQDCKRLCFDDPGICPEAPPCKFISDCASSYCHSAYAGCTIEKKSCYYN